MKKFYLLGFLLVTIACNDIEDCQLDPYVDFLGVSFNYLDPETEQTDFTFTALEVDGLGFFQDSDSTNSLTEFVTPGRLFLPVDITADSTTYRFYTDSINYFVTVDYDRQGYIYEIDCEAGIKFSQLSVKSTNLDSVRIVDVELNKNTLNNIEIYF